MTIISKNRPTLTLLKFYDSEGQTFRLSNHPVLLDDAQKYSPKNRRQYVKLHPGSWCNNEGGNRILQLIFIVNQSLVLIILLAILIIEPFHTDIIVNLMRDKASPIACEEQLEFVPAKKQNGRLRRKRQAKRKRK